VNSDALPEANWHATSTCEITGITSSGPSKTDQSFGHFIWNCPGQTSDISINDSFTVKGNFTVISTGSASNHFRISTSTSRTLSINGNFVQSSGIFILSSSGASSTMAVNGNLTINGGDFYISQGGGTNSLNIDGNFSLNNGRTFYMSTGTGYTNLNVKGHFAQSGDIRQRIDYPERANIFFNGTSTQIFTRYSGIFYYGINFTAKSTSTIDFGTSVLGHHLYSSGNFVLESGATLRTAHQQGITTSGASGCIQVSGTRTFPSGANYQFYRNGAQDSGNGLPSALNGVLTIGSPATSTHLTLPAGARTINNKLVLVSSAMANSSIVSGTLIYGSNSTLEYQGNSNQSATNAEFPSSNGPANLNINNANGVMLHNSRTLNGDLNLLQGYFSIGSNTLTLNGAVNQTSGALTGGQSSNLVMSGTGASANLPEITLNNLTINRSAGIVMNGSLNVFGAIALQNGNLSIGPHVIYLSGVFEQTGGGLTGGSESSLVIYTGNPTIIPPVTLGYINNMRLTEVTLAGDVTLYNGMWNTGNLKVPDKKLTISGGYLYNSGTLWIDGNGELQLPAGSGILVSSPGILKAHPEIRQKSHKTLAPKATIILKLTMALPSLPSTRYLNIWMRQVLR